MMNSEEIGRVLKASRLDAIEKVKKLDLEDAHLLLCHMVESNTPPGIHVDLQERNMLAPEFFKSLKEREKLRKQHPDATTTELEFVRVVSNAIAGARRLTNISEDSEPEDESLVDEAVMEAQTTKLKTIVGSFMKEHYADGISDCTTGEQAATAFRRWTKAKHPDLFKECRYYTPYEYAIQDHEEDE